MTAKSGLGDIVTQLKNRVNSNETAIGEISNSNQEILRSLSNLEVKVEELIDLKLVEKLSGYVKRLSLLENFMLNEVIKLCQAKLIISSSEWEDGDDNVK